jgi:hypothetical protein
MQAQIFSQDGLRSAVVYPWNKLAVQLDGIALFSDSFDGTTLDTTYRWNAPVVAGAGAVNVTGGLCSLTVGTGASSAVEISSQENFINVGVSFLVSATLIQFEAGSGGLLPLNNNSFFGFGNKNASYTAATPLQDSAGFERTIDGKFGASMYIGGVRTLIKDLTSYVLDGAPHLLVVISRGDTKYFYLDSSEVPIASINYFSPSTLNLPIRCHSVNHTSGPAAGPTLRFTGIQLVDTGYSYPVAFTGQTISRQRTPVIFKNLNLVSIATETTIWTPPSGRKFRLMGYMLTSGTVGGNVILKDNTAGSTILTIPFGAAGASLSSPTMGNGILSVTANNVLTATGTATQTLSGYVFGTEE